ncbi:PIN domain-containing protein [bacterium]|nr:PIN domain-containing protein [bacterium]
MILPDINILIYAYDESSKNHSAAKHWWEDQLNGSQMVALSWVTLLGFIRLLTNPRIYNNPFSPADTLGIVDSWLEQPHVKIIHPSERHFTLFSELIKQAGTAGNLTSDAHLAALAIERGLILQSTDADFSRFPGLKWTNPLKGKS